MLRSGLAGPSLAPLEEGRGEGGLSAEVCNGGDVELCNGWLIGSTLGGADDRVARRQMEGVRVGCAASAMAEGPFANEPMVTPSSSFASRSLAALSLAAARMRGTHRRGLITGGYSTGGVNTSGLST